MVYGSENMTYCLTPTQWTDRGPLLVRPPFIKSFQNSGLLDCTVLHAWNAFVKLELYKTLSWDKHDNFASTEPKQVRLRGGKDQYSGRLEVYVQGPNEWGTICDDFWDKAAAEVACRQLGFTGGKPIKEAVFGAGTGPIWFDNVKCFGNESSIWDCNHRGIGTHNCNHTEDVGIICECKYNIIRKIQLLHYLYFILSA